MMTNIIDMTDDQYDEWVDQYRDYSYTDLVDVIYDKLCEIERLKKKIDEVVKNHQESIEYQSKIDNEREYYEQHSRDMYKDQDLGPVWG